jgi:hypothetical protein
MVTCENMYCLVISANMDTIGLDADGKDSFEVNAFFDIYYRLVLM